jgi:hypothetical protein
MEFVTTNVALPSAKDRNKGALGEWFENCDAWGVEWN